jgi:hypothetical protein
LTGNEQARADEDLLTPVLMPQSHPPEVAHRGSPVGMARSRVAARAVSR